MKIAVASIIFALLTSAANSEASRYEYKDGRTDVCLEDVTGSAELEFPVRRNPYGGFMVTRFLVPAPYPTSNKLDPPERTGISASFFPVSDISYASRLERRTNPPPGACLVEDFEHGLLRLETNKDYQPEGTAPARCRVPHFELRLVPQDKTIPTQISCPLAPRTGACKVSHFMSNGWEAEFLLSVENLSEWTNHISLVEDFFARNLRECE